MGIFRLFRYYLTHYDGFFRSLRKPYKGPIGSQKPADYCDWLLVDTNAIMHPAIKGVFFPDTSSLQHIMMMENSDPVQLSYQDKEDAAFDAVWQSVCNLIKLIQPRKGIFLAIDGVPGLCKQSQQRKRRFKSYKDTDKDLLRTFDGSQLTCGTAFMDRLCSFLRQKCQTHLKSQFKKLDILYSDMYVPGEGEHKLIRWIETQSHDLYYTIYSPDADLIMLSLILPQPHVHVLRENIYNDVYGDWLHVNIDKLRLVVLDTIVKHFPDLQKRPDWNPKQCLKDYVLYFMLLGNDFLPHGSGLEIINEGVQQLNYAYSNTLMNSGYLINHMNHINIKTSFTHLFQQLSVIEPLMLAQKRLLNKWNIPDELIVNHTIMSLDGKEAKINFETYRKEYYKKKFNIDIDNEHEQEIRTICYEYVHGLAFVIQYYSASIPSFDWFYPYHYPPLSSDILAFLESLNDAQAQEINIFEFKQPLNVLESLISVLPIGSFDSCLPLTSDRISKLALKISEHKEYASYFPTTFEVDCSGVINEYEGTCILPIMNSKQVKTLCRGLPKPLIKYGIEKL